MPFFRTNRDVTEDTIRTYLEQELGINNRATLVALRRPTSALIISFHSVKPDKVIPSILKTLKTDTKSQFSGAHPAFLCIYLADLDHKQLRYLANIEHSGTITGFSSIVSTLFESRPHLHTIAWMSEGEVRITRKRSHNRIDTSTREAAPCYAFKNQRHPAAKEALLNRLFIANH